MEPMDTVANQVASDDVIKAVEETSAAADSTASQQSSDYEFAGKHLLISYSGCRIDHLIDVRGVLQAFKIATVAAGATILSESHHVFPRDGFTAMLLLSESHASIHTYPEHASCFVDLFTCGDHCDGKIFDRVLREYFEPSEVQAKTILRSSQIKQL